MGGKDNNVIYSITILYFWWKVVLINNCRSDFEDGILNENCLNVCCLGRKIKIVKYLINSRLEKLLTCRDSLFERVYPVSAALAKRLISSGHKHPSVFGKWDPVDLLNKNSCVQPLSIGNNATFAAVYRQHVYFLSSSTNRQMFMDQPRMFVMQPPPKASIPIQIAIIGAPKSGKTTC